MLMNRLLPSVVGLKIAFMTVHEGVVLLEGWTTSRNTECPVCHHLSGRIHSRYQRTIADLPWAGMAVKLLVQVRRFTCDNPTCERKLFCERLGCEVTAYARRTMRMTQHLYHLAMKLGGEAGTEIVSLLQMSVSASTLLRLMRRIKPVIAETPRVLGVDDWAKRKGQSYGTILVDLEKRQVVDLLPERSSEVLSEWLQTHPGVEIIVRDRAAEYKEGATQGAPAAIQVADRFHLLQNLTDMLRRICDRHPKQLRQAAKQATESLNQEPSQPEFALLPALEETVSSSQPNEVADDSPSQTQDATETWGELRFAEVKALQRQGLSQRAVAEQLKIHRQTVKKYWVLDACPQRQSGNQSVSSVTPYLAYVQQRWQEGCQNCQQLFEEIQKKGFTGSYMSVWRAVAKAIKEGRFQLTPKPTVVVVPAFSARKAAWLLTCQPDELDPFEKMLRQTLCQLCEEVNTAAEMALGFSKMVKERLADSFDDWLMQSERSSVGELKRFAVNLRRDYAAVKAALTEIWSNGQTEGQVHRLKLVKRQMYGRAKFDLLRLRVLHTMPVPP